MLRPQHWPWSFPSQGGSAPRSRSLALRGGRGGAKWWLPADSSPPNNTWTHLARSGGGPRRAGDGDPGGQGCWRQNTKTKPLIFREGLLEQWWAAGSQWVWLSGRGSKPRCWAGVHSSEVAVSSGQPSASRILCCPGSSCAVTRLFDLKHLWNSGRRRNATNNPTFCPLLVSSAPSPHSRGSIPLPPPHPVFTLLHSHPVSYSIFLFSTYLPIISQSSVHLPVYLWIYLLSAAAAAKSLQSCPTLCDPTDGSPPGSPIPGILKARTLEWVAIFFSNVWKWKVKVKSLSPVVATWWTAAYQAPPSMGFPRQEYWSGVPLPSLTYYLAIIYLS